MVEHFLGESSDPAARELVVIGEQNLARDTFSSGPLESYKRLHSMCDGDAVVSDNDAYLENYRRLVSQIGRSFPNTGIEVLFHNLVNPARSLVAIENGEVTGRSQGREPKRDAGKASLSRRGHSVNGLAQPGAQTRRDLLY